MTWLAKQIERFFPALAQNAANSKSGAGRKSRTEGGEASDSKPRRLDYALLASPELAITQASKETVRFASVMEGTLDCLSEAISSYGDDSKFQAYRDKLVDYEEVSDRFQYEIVNFLGCLNKDNVSDSIKAEAIALIRTSGELESLGDRGEAVSRSLRDMMAYGKKLTLEHIAKLCKMTGFLEQAYEDMVWNLENSSRIRDIRNAEVDDESINDFCDKCRSEVDATKNLETELYLNTMEQLRKIGDSLIGISEALMRASNKKMAS